MTDMEKSAARVGTFNMAKEEGIKACEEYRANLEAKGYRTVLQYREGYDKFRVMVVMAGGELVDGYKVA